MFVCLFVPSFFSSHPPSFLSWWVGWLVGWQNAMVTTVAVALNTSHGNRCVAVLSEACMEAKQIVSWLVAVGIGCVLREV